MVSVPDNLKNPFPLPIPEQASGHSGQRRSHQGHQRFTGHFRTESVRFRLQTDKKRKRMTGAADESGNRLPTYTNPGRPATVPCRGLRVHRQLPGQGSGETRSFATFVCLTGDFSNWLATLGARQTRKLPTTSGLSRVALTLLTDGNRGRALGSASAHGSQCLVCAADIS